MSNAIFRPAFPPMHDAEFENEAPVNGDSDLRSRRENCRGFLTHASWAENLVLRSAPCSQEKKQAASCELKMWKPIMRFKDRDTGGSRGAMAPSKIFSSY